MTSATEAEGIDTSVFNVSGPFSRRVADKVSTLPRNCCSLSLKSHFLLNKNAYQRLQTTLSSSWSLRCDIFFCFPAKNFPPNITLSSIGTAVSFISLTIISATVIALWPQLCQAGINYTACYSFLPTCSETHALTCVIPHLRLNTFADTAVFQISVLSCP